MIHLGMLLPPMPDRRWHLARQAGVVNVITKLTGSYRPWILSELQAAVKSFEDFGFKVVALEGDQMDMSRIKLGLAGKEDDIAQYRQMLTNMGACNIHLLCYNFMAGIGWYRSRKDIPARGGALTSGFFPEDVPELPLKFTHDRLWKNYTAFLKAVLPAAEAAGVRMALHPDDPSVPSLKGFPRIFTNADAFRRMLKIADSPAAAITFCAATFRQMGEDDLKLIQEWKDKIAFAHLRDNRSDGNGFIETFHDDAPHDMPSRFRLINDLNMDILIRPDHAPTMFGETNEEPGYAALGRILAVGFFKGIMKALDIQYD